MKDEVKRQGLWAAHLPPDMGGLGFGQVKLGLMQDEILGQLGLRAEIFGNNVPDSGNAELIAVGGTDEQKERWMQPLLDGTYRSCFSMTEPGAGADPTLLTTTAVRDGDEWVINGHKWFSSNASVSDFPPRDGQDRRHRRQAVPVVLDDHRADRHAWREHRARRADDG